MHIFVGTELELARPLVVYPASRPCRSNSNYNNYIQFNRGPYITIHFSTYNKPACVRSVCWPGARPCVRHLTCCA